MIPTEDAAESASRSPLNVGAARIVELTSNPRVPLMLQLAKEISRADDPGEVLRIFGQGIRRLRPVEKYISLSTRDLDPGNYRITRFVENFDRLDSIQNDPWSQRHTLPVHRGGLLGWIIERSEPVILQ